MRKATHLGTCQACGRLQMLPGGLLAEHGFEIRHGYRRGSCAGSGHLPYEQSKDLIESMIAAALASAERKRASAAALQAKPLGDLTCGYKVYHRELSNRSRGSVYLWHEGRLEGEGHGLTFVWASGAQEHRERLHRYGRPDAIARELRQAQAESILSSAGRSEKYAEWQRRRIADWAPAELVQRKAA